MKKRKSKRKSSLVLDLSIVSEFDGEKPPKKRVSQASLVTASTGEFSSPPSSPDLDKFSEESESSINANTQEEETCVTTRQAQVSPPVLPMRESEIPHPSSSKKRRTSSRTRIPTSGVYERTADYYDKDLQRALRFSVLESNRVRAQARNKKKNQSKTESTDKADSPPEAQQNHEATKQSKAEAEEPEAEPKVPRIEPKPHLVTVDNIIHSKRQSRRPSKTQSSDKADSPPEAQQNHEATKRSKAEAEEPKAEPKVPRIEPKPHLVTVDNIIHSKRQSSPPEAQQNHEATKQSKAEAEEPKAEPKVPRIEPKPHLVTVDNIIHSKRQSRRPRSVQDFPDTGLQNIHDAKRQPKANNKTEIERSKANAEPKIPKIELKPHLITMDNIIDGKRQSRRPKSIQDFDKDLERALRLSLQESKKTKSEEKKTQACTQHTNVEKENTTAKNNHQPKDQEKATTKCPSIEARGGNHARKEPLTHTTKHSTGGTTQQQLQPKDQERTATKSVVQPPAKEHPSNIESKKKSSSNSTSFTYNATKQSKISNILNQKVKKDAKQKTIIEPMSESTKPSSGNKHTTTTRAIKAVRSISNNYNQELERVLRLSRETNLLEKSKQKTAIRQAEETSLYGKRTNTTRASARIPTSFSLEQFIGQWKECEDMLGFTTDEIENGSLVRHANHHNSTSAGSGATSGKNQKFSSSQTGAQYGRILFGATQKLFNIVNLKSTDVFVDLGHGIGNTVLQAALTVGCDARGIEIVPERCRVAEQFHKLIFEYIEETDYMSWRRKIGNIEFREGCLNDKKNEDFIIEADVAFVNNANDIFGTRCTEANAYSIDYFVGCLFAKMKPGARMVTLYPLLCLGRSLVEENEHRRNCGLEEDINASFFTCDTYDLGKDSVNWSTGNTTIYVYTRVFQSESGDGTALFLCGNKRCTKKGHPTAVLNKNGLMEDNCLYCGMKRRAYTRKRD